MQPSTKPKIAKEVAEKVSQRFNFSNNAKPVETCNMSTETCNYLLSSALYSKLKEKIV